MHTGGGGGGGGGGGQVSPLQFPKSKTSVSNISDIAFNGCSGIIRTKSFTSFTVYATIFGQYMEEFF